MPALTPAEIEILCSVFRRHPEIRAVKLFGSRAKGTHTLRSDVDLALWGDVDALGAEAIAAELDELPLPYRYDAKAIGDIKLPSLLEHIERVGVRYIRTQTSCDLHPADWEHERLVRYPGAVVTENKLR